MKNIKEALGAEQIKSKFLLRGSIEGMGASVFRTSCNNRGPLLVIFKTKKGVLCGGFTSIPW